ncbi:efflux RND transporter periplasmic adaptor subunit, partial [Pseudomonas viridiflava]|uniref:efflux RND transporter periplasmic adaptor subunit n=1 Tax=Pseudomonas viridiflava TaxID=33069 RepID=UPI000F04854F
RAPFAGALGIRQVHLGQYVSQGQTLINLVGSQGFYDNFSVPEQALAYLAKDGAVEVALDSLPDQSTTAVIATLDPMLDRSRMINVQARLQQAPEAALPHMFARVRVPRASNQ